MAIIFCPECKKQISDTAKACPRCGYALTPEKVAELKEAQKLPKGCLVSIGIIGLVILLYVFFVSGSSSSPDEIGAYTAGQWFVEKRLKAPATADFPVYRDSFVTDLGSGRFKVESYVDAENGFGGQLRTHYTCIVRSDGSDWRLESISIR